MIVAIHNKNGQGLLPKEVAHSTLLRQSSQSTIKMDKGYYLIGRYSATIHLISSQSTIKMDKGYYEYKIPPNISQWASQSTIKIDKGYY